MRLNALKNTVLLFVLIAVSCGNSNHVEAQKTPLSAAKELNENKSKNAIIVGANHTESYLEFLRGKRIGVVANQTSVIFHDTTAVLEEGNKIGSTHLIDSLLSLDVSIKAVFSPEHGFRGEADAGELVSDGKDKKTGLPIYSLHGSHKKPSQTQLKDLDLVIFDIQDVGVRFYTYISTLHYVMEACAENDLPLLILDRPNPNGSYVDGPTLKKEHSSFLGMHPIPLVHGMTIGEYAKMINSEKWLVDGIQCELTIIPNENYDHDMSYHLPIRPSPNLPNDQAIALYPSLGLFEGTNINAGRGTEFQFQRYGAPFLDQDVFSFTYTPEPNFGSKHPKHEGEICYGKDLSEISIKKEMTLKYIIDAYRNSTDKSKVFNTKNFTTHAGTPSLQKQIEEGWTEEEIKETWQSDLKKFKEIRANYLIYD